MNYKMAIQKGKFEGLYPVYIHFFDSVKKLGGVIKGEIITFPDTVNNDVVASIVKPYKDYIRLERVDYLDKQ